MIDSNQIAFHLKEYESLRSELEMRIKQGQEAVLYTLFANAVVSSWFLIQFTSSENNSIILLVPIIPLLISSFGLWRYTTRIRREALLIDYTAKIESIISTDELGWNRYVETMPNRGYGILHPKYIDYTLFMVQILLSVAIITFVYLKEIK